MPAPAVVVEGIGKKYLLGTGRSRRLSESVAGWFAPSRRSRSSPDDILWALRDIDLKVEAGDILGIIGRNGAGKTTLLKILSRITEPTTGRALVRGRLRALLEVGTGFHSELTGRENIHLNGAILGMSRAEIRRKMDAIVSFAEVDRFLDTPVKRYSSGMFVRLGFSVAAHLESEVLIVDEVLSVGDAYFQRKCLGKMDEVASEGRTVLFVSHNLTAVRSLCSRGVLLHGGEVIADGSVEECLTVYLEDLVETLEARKQTADVPRPAGTTPDFKITDVELVTRSRSAVLQVAEPLRLRMGVDVKQPFPRVIFGFSVHGPDGTRIFEGRSVDSFPPVETVAPGHYEVDCVVPTTPLQPGLYSIDVGARSELGGLDWLQDVLALRVEEDEKIESPWLEEFHGLVRVKGKWKIEASG